MTAAAQLNSALAGRYTVLREIGQGGMATVYLAEDVRHQRRVALKVLNAELGAVLGVERFLAEIRVTANLQHPNLLPLFDSGEADGLLFYVMPYVEGESLRARIEREKQLPIDEALRIAVAVASALDYAHRHNVIHRDLKPENILLHEGQPLVADFGIALAVSNAGGNRITQTGLSLGTPQYMSPEQATGDRQLDGRSDIYSLGAVLYEMLTGEPPHSGTTAQAVIAKVITDRPRSIRLSRDTVPDNVEMATERALAKLPADRWATAHEFADALQGRGTGVAISRGITTPASVDSARRPVSMRERLRDPFLISLGVALVAATAAAIWLGARVRAGSRDPTLRLSLALPTDVLMAPAGGVAMAISRDGMTIVYNGVMPSGTFQLYVRRLGDLQVRPLPGSVLALDPSISPNGRWVAFTSGTQLYRVPIDGGQALPMGRASLQGTAWLDDQTVVAARDNRIMLFPTDGSTPVPLTTVDSARGERNHYYPVVSADGRHVFYQTIGPGGTRLGIVDVRTKKSSALNIDGIAVLGVVDDHLIYVTATGAVMAVRTDLASGRTTAEAMSLNEQVTALGSGVARAVLSASGTLVYQSGSSNGVLSVVDTRGVTRPLLEEPRSYSMPRYSPDGKRIAVAFDSDVWIYDIASKTLSRLTTLARNDRPEWTPDGKRVLFRTTRDGTQNLWWQAADGSGPPEQLLSLPDGPQEGMISPDGKWIIIRNVGLRTRRDIYYRALKGDTTLYPIAVSDFEELQPRISPNGKWVVYISNESGQHEVYVRGFPGPGGKVQVSVGGGTEPVWGPGSRQIYYKHGNDVVVATVATTPSFSVIERKKLFTTSNIMSSAIHANYDVAPNGKDLLLVMRAGPEAQVIVVHNWAKEMRERLRARE